MRVLDRACLKESGINFVFYGLGYLGLIAVLISAPMLKQGAPLMAVLGFLPDNLMHDLKTDRFFKPQLVNDLMEVGDGTIKTMALRGVKDNPPYMHDERLLTLDDTVEFFNLVLGDKLTTQEKHDLVEFMRAL